MNSKSPQRAKDKCANAKGILILGGSIYWECLHLSLTYRKQVPVFRVLSSAPNDTDELIEESGNVQSKDVRRKGD